MKASPEPCLTAITPAREALVVAGEDLLTWYGLAALGAHEGLPVVLGHARAICKRSTAGYAPRSLHARPAGRPRLNTYVGQLPAHGTGLRK